MGVSRVDNDIRRNTSARRFSTISRPEVGYWVALEGHQKEVINRESTEGDDHCPDNKDLKSVDAYLHEKYSNISF